MRGKLAFIVGAAVGYVLGSRAGRERYEQIRRGAKKLWNTEPVQKGVGVVRGAVDERADDVKLVARRLGSQLLSKMADQAAGKTQRRDDSAGTDAKATSASSTETRDPSTSEAPADTPGRAGKDAQ